MKLKKIVATVMAAALMTACAVPASAATAKTNTYYVNQEKTYGKLTLTSSKCSTKTYCELTSAGKIAAADLVYKKNGRTYCKTIQIGDYDNSTYTYNSATTATKSRSVGTDETYVSASSYHKVKITSYITWDSASCDGDNNGYDIPEIVL